MLDDDGGLRLKNGRPNGDRDDDLLAGKGIQNDESHVILLMLI